MRLKDIINLVEAKIDSPIVALHGTSSEYVSSILSQGLIPQKNTGFGSGLGGDMHRRSMDSVGGVYLTTDVTYARTAAAQVTKEMYNPLFVITSVQPKSFYEDEDNIVGNFERGMKQVTRGGFGPDLKRVFSTYYDVVHDNDLSSYVSNAILANLSQEQKELLSRNSRAKDLVVEFVEKWTQRVLSHAVTTERGLEYKFGDILRTKGLDRDRTVDIASDILINLPRQQQAEQEYMRIIEKLTVALKRHAYSPNREGDMFRSFRIDGPIGYRGNNKIIGIVEIDLDDDEFLVHYGNVPGIIKTQLEAIFETKSWEWL